MGPCYGNCYSTVSYTHLDVYKRQILGCSGYDLEAKEAHTKMLLSKRIDALILVSSTYAGREGHPEDVEYIKEAAKQTPVFLINGFIEGKKDVYKRQYCDRI